MPPRDRLWLVGLHEVNPVPGDNTLIATGFYRLPKEVKHTGGVTRLVGYETQGPADQHLRFFGIEVDEIENIPDGMFAWELGEREWSIWACCDGQDRKVWQGNIAWDWFALSADGRHTGEFAAGDSLEQIGLAGMQERHFRTFANAYVGVSQEGPNDEVYLAPYDPRWPAKFEEIANWLRLNLSPDVVLKVEHYGSTAIPGMPAKPVIDILVEVPSFQKAKERILPFLNDETWEYWWYSDHLFFMKREGLMGHRICHVHVAPRDHGIWRGILFRDYLRSHSDAALQYAALKSQLAASYGSDREMYTTAKADFVRKVTAKALGAS